MVNSPFNAKNLEASFPLLNAALRILIPEAVKALMAFLLSQQEEHLIEEIGEAYWEGRLC